MPCLLRPVLIAAALACGLCAAALADQQQVSPPHSAWSNRPLQEPRETPADRYATSEPAGEARRPLPAPSPHPHQAPTGHLEPPRTLPAAYAAPIGQVPPQPRQLARPAAAQQPVKLPPAAEAAEGHWTGNLKPLVTGGTSLALVLGLFLVILWTVRRGSPGASGVVPSEAVEVLGRVPIAGRQQAHLVRCGNKIVLVSVTASGMESLTEISDPMEVDRLDAICRQSSTPGRPLKHFLARFGSQADVAFPGDMPESIDFRHLESGSREF